MFVRRLVPELLAVVGHICHDEAMDREHQQGGDHPLRAKSGAPDAHSAGMSRHGAENPEELSPKFFAAVDPSANIVNRFLWV